MDTSKIKRPQELWDDLPQPVIEDIEDLLDAMERDDENLDLFYDQVHSASRMVFDPVST